METSEVRRHLREMIETSKRGPMERHVRIDAAYRDYQIFLERVAVPLFKQAANVLKAESYAFTVFTPGDGVRLMSDRGGQDFVELVLDSSGPTPVVIGRSSRARGGNVIQSERPIGTPVREITEWQVLAFIVEALAEQLEG